MKYPDSAGIDIGKKAMFVAVSPSVAEQNVRSFSTVTADLKAIAVARMSCNVRSDGGYKGLLDSVV